MEVVPRKRRPYSTLEKLEMKKTLVAMAALSAVAAFSQTTDGKPGVQIQGNFNGGYQANSYKGVKVSGFDQNGAGTSQINVRVLEDLGGGMAAYARVENDMSIMNNAANQGVIPNYSTPNTTAPGTGSLMVTTANTGIIKTTSGIAGTWGNGELAVGLRSPVGDFAFGALNNSGLNYIVATALPTQGTSFGGGYGMTLGADPSMASVRWANSFRYLSPTINGVQASFVYAEKQSNGTATLSSKTGVASTTTSLGVGLNNQIGAKELGLKYANGPLTAAGVYAQTSITNFCAAPSTTATANMATLTAAGNNPCYSTTTLSSAVDASQDAKQTSFAASYALPAGFLVSAAMQNTTLGALGSGSTVGDVSSRKATTYNLQYESGVHKMFTTLGYVKEGSTASAKNGITGKFVGLGYNYALSKNSSLVARYESFQDDTNVLALKSGDVSAYTQTQGTVAADTKRIRTMVGLNVNF